MNVSRREAEIRESCVVGPVKAIQGKSLLLGLICDRAAAGLQSELLARDILTGTSADPRVLRLLPPVVLQAEHVQRLSETLRRI